MALLRQNLARLVRRSLPLNNRPRFSVSASKFRMFSTAESKRRASKGVFGGIFGAITGAGLAFVLASRSPTMAEEDRGNAQARSTSEAIMGGPVVTRSGRVIPKLKVFVGYDPREDLAYEVCRHSILKHATVPVEVIPIKQSDLRKAGLYWRPRGPTESTEFSFSRFLTPFLAGFDGWAMFVDCDFLYTADIRELFEMSDDKYAIMCVKHDYKPNSTTKMDGVPQTVYPRKNWSSMVLYNCEHPKNRVLTPTVVNSQSGAFLHRFMWLDDGDIGEIPYTWNFLVGHNKVDEQKQNPPNAIHYTMGGPWFDAWKNCEFADLWLQEVDEYKRSQMIQRVIQDELIRLLDARMDEKSGELEARVQDLEGKVKEMSALQKLLLFYLQEKLLASNANGTSVKESAIDA
eukprot:TRINITY_DN8637_c0_g1_i1.p1 TRINITY_DN8637_c0_g1~~TRINITY_DN8637_c0_g1_i1.p1  ORF type:complete len:412 (+),score=30.41 TRINITY_DN8637_c0_g1_i1:30-1238(+)